MGNKSEPTSASALEDDQDQHKLRAGNEGLQTGAKGKYKDLDSISASSTLLVADTMTIMSKGGGYEYFDLNDEQTNLCDFCKGD